MVRQVAPESLSPSHAEYNGKYDGDLQAVLSCPMPDSRMGGHRHRGMFAGTGTVCAGRPLHDHRPAGHSNLLRSFSKYIPGPDAVDQRPGGSTEHCLRGSRGRRHRVVLVTHCYMYDDDTRVGKNDRFGIVKRGSITPARVADPFQMPDVSPD